MYVLYSVIINVHKCVCVSTCKDVYRRVCAERISKFEPMHSGYMITHGESALLRIIALLKACSECCVAKANCVQ